MEIEQVTLYGCVALLRDGRSCARSVPGVGAAKQPLCWQHHERIEHDAIRLFLGLDKPSSVRNHREARCIAYADVEADDWDLRCGRPAVQGLFIAHSFCPEHMLQLIEAFRAAWEQGPRLRRAWWGWWVAQDFGILAEPQMPTVSDLAKLL